MNFLTVRLNEKTLRKLLQDVVALRLESPAEETYCAQITVAVKVVGRKNIEMEGVEVGVEKWGDGQ